MANAGRYEPGETYVYEKSNGVTYARKIGDPPDQRFEIGRDYSSDNELKIFGMSAQRVARLVDMEKQAEHNPALQDALDRAKVIYELSRQEQTVDHHPV